MTTGYSRDDIATCADAERDDRAEWVRPELLRLDAPEAQSGPAFFFDGTSLAS